MIDTKELRFAASKSTRDLALLPSEVNELLDRLEAAEKERDAAELMSLALRAKIETAENDAAHQKALAESALRVAEGWERKCGELRALVATLRSEISGLHAKIAQMEQQEPVAFGLYSGWALKATYLKEHEACEQRDRRQLTADLGGSLEAYRVAPLYTLPGAQSAPSVPEDIIRDAVRYRFLRATKNIPISSKAARDPVVYDEAIDAAMLAAAPEAKP